MITFYQETANSYPKNGHLHKVATTISEPGGIVLLTTGVVLAASGLSRIFEPGAK